MPFTSNITCCKKKCIRKCITARYHCHSRILQLSKTIIFTYSARYCNLISLKNSWSRAFIHINTIKHTITILEVKPRRGNACYMPCNLRSHAYGLRFVAKFIWHLQCKNVRQSCCTSTVKVLSRENTI